MPMFIRALFLLWLLLPCSIAFGQIIGPDTVCPGTTVTFSTPAQGRSFTWFFENNPDITPIVPSTPSPSLSGGLLNLPSIFCMTNHNGSWYTFVTNYSTSEVIRLSYGNSPLNTPTAQSLGSFGMNGGIAGGIDLVKDDVSGNWFGFCVNAGQLLRLEFGNSPANMPTGTLMNYSSYFDWPHEMRLKKIGSNWIGFVANRSGAMTRLNWGSNLSAPPVATNLPITNYSAPVAFSLSRQGNNWYLFVVSLLGSYTGLTRLDLGTDVQNNTPVATYLGNFGGQLFLPRGTEIISDCDQVYGYVMNESGALYKIDFNNNITNNTPAISSLANMSSNAISMYMYNNQLRAQILSSTTNTLRTLSLQTYAPATVTNYYDNQATHTFNTPGIYTVTLWTDQGILMGGTAYCKQIVVTNNASFLGPDTSICGNGGYALNAPAQPSAGYLWSTGATTPSITVTQSGTYWVHLTNTPCSAGDTVQVTFKPLPSVTTNADTSICKGMNCTLSASGASTYTWHPATYLNNTGIANPVAQPQQSITYYVTGTGSNGCRKEDSVRVTVNPIPLIQASNDTSVCGTATVFLTASGGTNYSWTPASYLDNPGIANPQARPEQSITYYVSSTDGNGCTGKDSVRITVRESANIHVSPDTAICLGKAVQLEANGAVTYSWHPTTYLNNTASATPVSKPSETITYYLTGTDAEGCNGKDSVTIRVNPLPSVKATTQTPQTDCGADGVQLLATGANSYNWIPAALCNSSTVADPIATLMESQVFYVTGTDSKGCSNIDSVLITVRKDDILFVPNAFSPNGDGLNDIFTPRIYCDLDLVNCSVYNRYGQLVHRIARKNDGWDGTMNGQPCDAGTYFWYLEGRDKSGKKITKKGNIILIR